MKVYDYRKFRRFAGSDAPIYYTQYVSAAEQMRKETKRKTQWDLIRSNEVEVCICASLVLAAKEKEGECILVKGLKFMETCDFLQPYSLLSRQSDLNGKRCKQIWFSPLLEFAIYEWKSEDTLICFREKRTGRQRRRIERLAEGILMAERAKLFRLHSSYLRIVFSSANKINNIPLPIIIAHVLAIQHITSLLIIVYPPILGIRLRYLMLYCLLFVVHVLLLVAIEDGLLKLTPNHRAFLSALHPKIQRLLPRIFDSNGALTTKVSDQCFAYPAIVAAFIPFILMAKLFSKWKLLALFHWLPWLGWIALAFYCYKIASPYHEDKIPLNQERFPFESEE